MTYPSKSEDEGMYVADGRLRGNLGVYIVTEAADAWEAERILRAQTAMLEQIRFERPSKVGDEETRHQIIDGLHNPWPGPRPSPQYQVHNLGGNAFFVEGQSISALL